MSQVMSKQLVSSSEGSAKRQGRAVTATLWTVQILLALLFLFAGLALWRFGMGLLKVPPP